MGVRQSFATGCESGDQWLWSRRRVLRQQFVGKDFTVLKKPAPEHARPLDSRSVLPTHFAFAVPEGAAIGTLDRRSILAVQHAAATAYDTTVEAGANRRSALQPIRGEVAAAKVTGSADPVRRSYSYGGAPVTAEQEMPDRFPQRESYGVPFLGSPQSSPQ